MFGQSSFFLVTLSVSYHENTSKTVGIPFFRAWASHTMQDWLTGCMTPMTTLQFFNLEIMSRSLSILNVQWRICLFVAQQNELVYLAVMLCCSCDRYKLVKTWKLKALIAPMEQCSVYFIKVFLSSETNNNICFFWVTVSYMKRVFFYLENHMFLLYNITLLHRVGINFFSVM